VWSADGPMRRRTYAGAELVVNVSASPFRVGMQATRRELLATRAADRQCTLAYVNLVGANDGLVFDGGGFVFQNGRQMLEAPRFREGFQFLARFDLAFDAWVYHPQLSEIAELAASFPDTPIVLNHFGSPILGGPNAGRVAEAFAEWRAVMTALASHDNVHVKLGALPVRRSGPGRQAGAPPLSSEDIAAAWRPFFEVCVEKFGAHRCMFESNFPVQKRWCSYPVLWNACKRLAAGASAAEKSALFSGTAARVYRLPAGLD